MRNVESANEANRYQSHGSGEHSGDEFIVEQTCESDQHLGN
jgi:hypothetical protein